MRKALVITEKEDLILKVYETFEEIVDKKNDFSPGLVVFPGKRPGHYLRKLIGEKIGTSYIPPTIYSMDEFVNSLISDSALRHAETIDAIHLLYELSIKSDAIHEEFKKFDSFYPFGSRLFNILEELSIEDIPYEKIRTIETLIPMPEKSSDSIKFLSDLYRDFYAELPKRGLSTRSLRYKMAADVDEIDLAKRLGKFRRLLIAGFFVFTAQERRLINKLLNMSSPEVLLFFQDGEGIEDTIKRFKLQDSSCKNLKIERQCDSATVRQSVLNLISAPDIHGMVKAAGTILKESSQIDERTVVVLPRAETLFPLLRQGIPYMDEGFYNISMGYPIQRTPLYGFFMSLFDAINSIYNDHIYMPRYLRFMLHPYVKNIYFKGSAVENRKIFHLIEKSFREEKIPIFVSLEELEGDITNEIFRDEREEVNCDSKDRSEQLRSIHDNTIRRFLNFNNIGHFMEECRRVLLFLYNNSTARLHPFFYPYVEAFIKEFDKVSLSGLRDMVFEHRESYFNLFKKLTAPLTVPFEGTPLKGLQILGVLETRNIKFNRVLFLDLNEGVFPNLSEDYILPYQVRKALGMPTYQDRERLAYYYFDILVRSAEEVYLVYINNDNTERSRFIERLLWERQKAGSKDVVERLASYRVKLSTPMPEPIQKTKEVINVINSMKLTPSGLDEYLVCGIKFYFSQILGLKKGKDLTGDPDRSEIGNIVHKALKEYFAKRLHTSLKRENCSTLEIDGIVDKIFYEKYRNISGTLYLMRYQIKKRLKEILEQIPEIFLVDSKDFIIQGVEETIMDNLFNTPFECRIDAIGRAGERMIIIDYKISGDEKNVKINFNKLDPLQRSTWSKTIKSLQMPFYMFLYGKAKGSNLENLDGYYFLLGKSSIDGDALYNPFKDIKKTEALSILSEIIKSLVSEIKDPDKPFHPPQDFNDACKICDFTPFCATEWVERNNY